MSLCDVMLLIAQQGVSTIFIGAQRLTSRNVDVKLRPTFPDSREGLSWQCSSDPEATCA